MTSKVALVTGGSRGIGRSTVEHLARRGVDVLLTYKSRADEATAAVAAARDTGVSARAFQLDTGEAASFDAFALEQHRHSLRHGWFLLVVTGPGTGLSCLLRRFSPSPAVLPTIAKPGPGGSLLARSALLSGKWKWRRRRVELVLQSY